MNQSLSFCVQIFVTAFVMTSFNNNLQGRFNELQPEHILEGTHLSVAKSAQPPEGGEDGGAKEGGGEEAGGNIPSHIGDDL